MHEVLRQPNEAINVIDAMHTPDLASVQFRESAALRIAVRNGNLERVKLAVERLVPLRLDAQTLAEIAGQMRLIGMNEQAAAVVDRARPLAAGNVGVLRALMGQYQTQNRFDQAAEIAYQILRLTKTPPLVRQRFAFNNDEDAQWRTMALTFLARSGRLSSIITRTEAQSQARPRSFGLLEALNEYYGSLGDKTKVGTTLERMVRLRPEDATLRFQYARHLKEAGDTSAAIEQYKTAIETDASVYFMNGWYDVLPVFQTADRLDDLTKLLEKDHSEAVDYEEVHQLLQALLANSKYHGAAVSLLKATMSKGGYVPGTTFGSLLRDLTPKFLELPETEQIVRDEVIPVGIDLVKDNPWFGVNPELPKLLTVSAERGRLGRLGQDASTVSRKWPEWLGGKVLLKLIDLRLGRVEGVGDAIGTLVAANDPPMNSGARAAIARELAAVAELQDLALRLAEQGVERQDTKGGMFGQMSNYAGPTQLLVDLYYKTGHEAKARSTAMNYFRSVLPRQNDSSSVATNQLFNIAVLVGQHLLKIDDPLDALRVFATYQGRTGSSARKGQFVQSIDGELARRLRP